MTVKCPGCGADMDPKKPCPECGHEVPEAVKIHLSIAGGGFMGIGPARYLDDLDQMHRRLGYGPLMGRVSALAGTSVGAINCALLAAGKSPHEVLSLHRSRGAEIFGKRNWAYRLIKAGPQFDDAAINRILAEVLGDLTMDRTVLPLYIPTWDARRRDIKVFGPSDKGVLVRHAVRCSLAAPTYFAPVDARYVDGGLTANDPLLCGLAGATMDGVVDPRGVKCLELVTSGRSPEGGPIGTDWSAITTLRKVVLPGLTAGNASDVGYIARAWLKSCACAEDRVITVRPECPDWDLADVSKASECEALWAALPQEIP